MTFLLTLIICFGSSNFQVWGNRNGIMIIEERTPRVYVYDANSWSWSVSDADIRLLTCQDALKEMTFRWTSPYTLHQFNILSKFWNPGPKPKEPNIVPVPEPNNVIPDPMQTVWVNSTGTTYHLKTCRYVKSTSLEVDLIDALQKGLRPCDVCRPVFWTEMLSVAKKDAMEN